MMRWNSNKLLTVVAWATLLFTGCGGGESPDPPAIIDASALPELPQTVNQGEFPRGAPRAPVDVRIALVGEVRGELEPCGCPTLPYGGFTRRAVKLKELREAGPLFHLDAGELLLKGFSTDRSRDEKTRTDAMLRLSNEVGVDLWVPGPTDLIAIGPTKLRDINGPRRISASWQNAAGTALLPPSAILQKGGIRLGVIGLSAPIQDPDIRKEVITIDPVVAAKKALADLPDDLDLVIGLGNISDEAAERVVSEVEGLSALLKIRSGQYNEPTPSTLTDASTPPVLEAPDRGRYLQVFTFRAAGNPDRPALVYPEARLWRERAISGDDTPFEELGSGRNLVGVATIPLSKDLDGGQIGHQRVDAALDRFKTQSLNAAALRAKKAPAQNDPHYASSGGCVHCHSSEFARWSLSGHAQAWMALVTREETKNPECLSCHTTAWGEPSGLGELSASGIRKFKGVQCEACHGPMGGHPDDGRVRPQPIQEATCLTCHDEANSPDFEFVSYLRQASCQGGSPMPGVAP